MVIPLQITWRDVPQSDAIESSIRTKAEKLDRFYDGILSCRVRVESSYRHHHKGNLYRIRVEIEVPDGEIVASRDPAENHAHEDIYVAIRDAFDAARRQLQDYARIRRGKVKRHEPRRSARVMFKRPEEDFGFLRTDDGHEVYFHRNALIDADFYELEEGTEVTFVEEQGKKGPQAKFVTVGKSRRSA